MGDEQQQNLNSTTGGEATQRPQSLPRETNTTLSLQSPLSLQISALLLGTRRQSKEDIVLFSPIPGTAAQQAAWKSWQGTSGLGGFEQLHGAFSQRLHSCCWKRLRATLSPTGLLWFHRPLTPTAKVVVISRRLLPIHESSLSIGTDSTQ